MLDITNELEVWVEQYQSKAIGGDIISINLSALNLDQMVMKTACSPMLHFH